MRPLFFNDPEKGRTFELPSGEPCVEVDSIEEARKLGYLSDEQSAWAAKINLQRGYRLVWLKGMLRGVSESAIE